MGTDILVTQLQATVCARLFHFRALGKDDQLLLHMAAQARLKAQAPYSHYFVGACVRGQSGNIYTGCNVERVSYSQDTHAEQNALDSLVAKEGPAKVYTVAVVGAPEGAFFRLDAEPQLPLITYFDQLKAPSCAHCLQIIWENCMNDPGVRLISRQPNGQILVTTIGDVLTMRFGPTELGIDYEKMAKGGTF